MKKSINVLVGSTEDEKLLRESRLSMLKNTPIPDEELLSNLGLFLSRQTLSRVLFMNELYQRIIDIHGVVMEFGVRWGQNLALFQNFRGMYEPFNHSRKIIGFDTFDGFPEVSSKDGSLISAGDYSVTANYEKYLSRVLEINEAESPISHKKKYSLEIGDACIKLDEYLAKHPETIISLAYFDFDIYAPTKKCLESILPHLTKNSIIAFDELNCEAFPGETIALREVLGLSKYSIRRSPLNPLCSYIVID
ncbi:MAG: hypothetical protein WDA09_04865 [Bacteriovoracaceae bacterium]